MHHQNSIRTFAGASAAAASAVLMAVSMAGCASTNVDAQWRSVELPPAYLRGATVLVSCETGEVVVKRICEDQIAADLSLRGAKPVIPAPGSVAAPQPGVPDSEYLPVARENGAKAIFSVTIGLASQRVNQGFSIGVGGFGFGGGGGGFGGGGVGVSAPIGGGDVSNGYAANGRVTDATSGRLMWTARASAPPSGDVNEQIADLSKALLDAAGKAGLF